MKKENVDGHEEVLRVIKGGIMGILRGNIIGDAAMTADRILNFLDALAESEMEKEQRNVAVSMGLGDMLDEAICAAERNPLMMPDLTTAPYAKAAEESTPSVSLDDILHPIEERYGALPIKTYRLEFSNAEIIKAIEEGLPISKKTWKKRNKLVR